MANLSKIYANAVAAYNEGRLLSGEKIRRLIDADFSDTIKMLYDYGYGGGIMNESSYDIDAFISMETAKLVDYVVTDSPNQYLTNILINRFIYLNAKAIYKNKFIKSDIDKTIYNLEINAEIKKAVETADYNGLSIFLSDAFKLLDESFLDKKVKPQEIDLTLTKAMYAENFTAVKKSKSKMMKDYLTAEIDLTNILSMSRAKLLGLNEAAAKNLIIEGGILQDDDIMSILKADNATISNIFMMTPYYDAVVMLLENNDLVQFETCIDEYLYLLTSKNSNDMLTFSPFINYFFAQLMEFKVVKTILVCQKNNVKGEIAKRLRSIYD